MSVPAGASAALAHRLVPDLARSDDVERPIMVDQTNESVVVGERVVVKWLQPPVPQPHPAQILLSHLSEVGFTEMPVFHGVEIRGDDVVAVVTGYVPRSQDGWEWYVDDLSEALDTGDTAVPMAWAQRIGALAARLHDALATPSTVVPNPVSAADAADEAGRGLALLDDALDCTAGAEGQRLADRAGMIRSIIEAVGHLGHIPVQRIHGDLHVGQLLRSGETLFVNDFDGSPVADTDVRSALRSAMVDVGSLLQSIDHVGRVVARRMPQHTDAIQRFLSVALPACRDAYAARRPLSAAERQLLTALQVIQELHEFVYSSRSLPRWLYVPDAALAAMFP